MITQKQADVLRTLINCSKDAAVKFYESRIAVFKADEDLRAFIEELKGSDGNNK